MPKRVAVDFSDIPTNEPVPAGMYTIVVENVEWRQSKDKIDEDTGNLSEYLNWELAITDGDFANRRLFTITSLKKKALWKLRSVFTNLAVDYDPDRGMEIDDDSNQVIYPELVGLIGTAEVVEGSYNGKPRSEVANIFDPDGIDLEKAMRDERRAEKKASNGKAPGQQESFIPRGTRAASPPQEQDPDFAPDEEEGPATGATRPLRPATQQERPRKMTLR